MTVEGASLPPRRRHQRLRSASLAITILFSYINNNKCICNVYPSSLIHYKSICDVFVLITYALHRNLFLAKRLFTLYTKIYSQQGGYISGTPAEKSFQNLMKSNQI